jgi:hypothetical protein
MKAKLFILAALSTLGSVVQALPNPDKSLSERQSTNRLVFAHFMVSRLEIVLRIIL